MEIDLRDRINNAKLGYRRCLVPLFEAIANSVQAIQDLGTPHGAIDIFVERDMAGVLDEDWEEGQSIKPVNRFAYLEKNWSASPLITGFVIQDNGVGFTDEHFHSFKTLGTTMKAER